jgi:formate dehydrogenase subunit gamma
MLAETTIERIQALVVAKKNMPGALLPILHDVQDVVGYIPADSVNLIAQELNLSRAEVHGVVTFYHYFRHEAPEKTIVQVCRAEACQSMGCDQLWTHACATVNAAYTLEPVYCLGLCSSSPAISINEKVHARISIDKFDQLVAAARSVA